MPQPQPPYDWNANLQQAIALANPPADVQVGEGDWLDKLLMSARPGIAGKTSLAGNVALNRPVMEANQFSPQDIASTITHELEHSRQARGRGVLGQLAALISDNLPYEQRGDELAAYQVENADRLRRGLSPNPVPDFYAPGSGRMVQRHDIALPSPADDARRAAILERLRNGSQPSTMTDAILQQQLRNLK